MLSQLRLTGRWSSRGTFPTHRAAGHCREHTTARSADRQQNWWSLGKLRDLRFHGTVRYSKNPHALEVSLLFLVRQPDPGDPGAARRGTEDRLVRWGCDLFVSVGIVASEPPRCSASVASGYCHERSGMGISGEDNTSERISKANLTPSFDHSVLRVQLLQPRNHVDRLRLEAPTPKIVPVPDLGFGGT
jgi:hypothetical protein